MEYLPAVLHTRFQDRQGEERYPFILVPHLRNDEFESIEGPSEFGVHVWNAGRGREGVIPVKHCGCVNVVFNGNSEQRHNAPERSRTDALTLCNR